MIKTPVNGMKDILPIEMSLRQYLLKNMREVYKSYGFLEIETPTIEHIENLSSKDGWDNEKLIFKILKRGEKLKKAIEEGASDLVDEALRYDLTLPLSRFISNNKQDLPLPFKAMQIGNVYRADRPQKGRYRQFMQADIDIFGDNTNKAEIDLFLATTSFFKKINFDKYNFYYEINDRRILKALVEYSGFNEEEFENICIILDKIDKIGIDKVLDEIINLTSEKEKSQKLIDTLKLSDENACTIQKIGKICDLLKDYLDSDVKNNLIQFVEIINNLTDTKIVFSPYLVRGMGYYTATIFEIKSPAFSSSIGGGGRYDNMLQKFTNEKIPACGISIGFERIVSILMDDNKRQDNEEKVAYLIDDNIDTSELINIYKQAQQERKNGKIINMTSAIKNKRFQKEMLSKYNFNEFIDYYKK